MNTPSRRRGFSLVEVMIVMVIASMILGATWLLVSTVMQNDDALRARVDLQLQCSNAVKEIVSLLKQSGVIDTNSNWTNPAGVANSDADNEYPYVFTLGTTAAVQTPFSTAGYLNFNNFAQGGYQAGTPPAHYLHTCVQYPNTKAEEGLGVSRGILFRIAKDSDRPADKRGMAVPKGTNLTDLPIEWGNEYHAFSVVRNTITGYNELVHFVWDAAKAPKSQNVLAANVSRLIFEVKGLPANPVPLWPLPSGRAMNKGESTASYTAALNQTYPAEPTNPFEIRVTLCLAKPDVNNANNSLNNTKRMSTVWQQANINMRSIPH